MAFCAKCGKDMGAYQTCPNCGNGSYGTYGGEAINGYERQQTPQEIMAYEDVPKFLFRLLCFFTPFVGALMYAIMMPYMPNSAKSYGRAAVAGTILYIIIFVLYIIFVPVFIMAMSSSISSSMY